MRFLVDMPISPAIAAWLRAQGYDAVHASDVGLFNSSDELILERAVQESRVIITADLDYPRLLALSDATGPGLVLFRGGQWRDTTIQRKLTQLFDSIPLDELPHSIVTIETARIRRRRLPIL